MPLREESIPTAAERSVQAGKPTLLEHLALPAHWIRKMMQRWKHARQPRGTAGIATNLVTYIRWHYEFSTLPMSSMSTGAKGSCACSLTAPRQLSNRGCRFRYWWGPPYKQASPDSARDKESCLLCIAPPLAQTLSRSMDRGDARAWLKAGVLSRHSKAAEVRHLYVPSSAIVLKQRFVPKDRKGSCSDAKEVFLPVHERTSSICRLPCHQ
jgi:hypothetical protein